MGIPLAVRRFGVGACHCIAVSVSLNSAIAYSMAPHSSLFVFASTGPLVMDFGVEVVSTNVANCVYRKLDNVFIGRVFGELWL